MEFFPYFAVVSGIVVILNAIDLIKRDKYANSYILACVYSICIIYLAGVM